MTADSTRSIPNNRDGCKSKRKRVKRQPYTPDRETIEALAWLIGMGRDSK